MAKVPINITSGKLQEENVIVGIDLGTTNSLIAKMEEGQPQAIADFDKDVIVPSVIHFAGETPEVGETAKDYLIQDPQNTIYSVKRLMGKSYKDVSADKDYFSYNIIDDESDEESLVKVQVGNKFYTPIELSSVILKELRRRAEHRLKTDVQQAVITVPAYFNDAQRQATRDAGKIAGLDVMRILNEPTAAALAYGIGRSEQDTQTVAVYDMGGGTFDITLLKIEQGIFEVLATNGDTYLGGDDFDRAVVNQWMEDNGISEQDLNQDPSLTQTLRIKAEEAKKHLAEQPTFEAQEPSESGRALTLKLTREQFSELAQPYIERTLASCRQALQDAELSARDIDNVILVGGSTRTPQVRQAVAEFFGQQPFDELNPDEVVALGAAVQADILAGNRSDMVLLDVTPLSLGIETMGGLMDVLIPRNSKIPGKASRQYTTSVDGQTNLKVAVYQGEREQVSYNRKLAEFELRGIPAMPAGLPKIEITFMLDADGILHVSAEEQRSGVKQQVQVKPQYGLTDEQVEQMLMESLQHAEEDVAERMKIEAKQEGEQMIYNTENFLQKYAPYFEQEQYDNVQAYMQKLREQIEQEDKDAIQAAIQELDDYTKPIAERVLNDAVSSALSGKDVDQARADTEQ